MLDFCFCSALTGVVRWSVQESLVRGVWCPLTYNCVGVVGGALASWGDIVQLARSADVTITSHTTTMGSCGSWEVHTDVGLVSAGEDTLWGVLDLVWGGWAEVLLWDVCAVSGTNGVTVDSGWVSSIFCLVTPAGSSLGWWHTDARGGWYLCVVAVLRFRCWTGHEHILLGRTL
jgi:hypothetical protein